MWADEEDEDEDEFRVNGIGQISFFFNQIDLHLHSSSRSENFFYVPVVLERTETFQFFLFTKSRSPRCSHVCFLNNETTIGRLRTRCLFPRALPSHGCSHLRYVTYLHKTNECITVWTCPLC